MSLSGCYKAGKGRPTTTKSDKEERPWQRPERKRCAQSKLHRQHLPVLMSGMPDGISTALNISALHRDALRYTLNIVTESSSQGQAREDKQNPSLKLRTQFISWFH